MLQILKCFAKKKTLNSETNFGVNKNFDGNAKAAKIGLLLLSFNVEHSKEPAIKKFMPFVLIIEAHDALTNFWI